MTSRTEYCTQTPNKPSLFDVQYLRNHRTSDIGILGYIGIVWPKEHSPEVRSFPPGSHCIYSYCYCTTAPSGSGPPQCWGFMITLRHTTVGRTPLDEWSVRRRDLYLSQQTDIHASTGFDPATPASLLPQTQTLDHAANGIGFVFISVYINRVYLFGTFAKLQITIITFVMAVRLSARNNSAPTGLIFMNFDIWGFFDNLYKRFNFH